jgi:hypothetical protein
MNLYFLSLLEEKRKRTRWLVFKEGTNNGIGKRKLRFAYSDNQDSMMWFESDQNVLGMRLFSRPEREWNLLFFHGLKYHLRKYVDNMVELHSLLENETFKKKNLILRLTSVVACTIKVLSQQ